MSLKFTVIVPTRERADTLEKALQTITAQDYDNLEILVSDNCSADRTPEVVAGLKDPRVRYVRTPGRLSMADNWEFALSQATGDWITMVGDDDGLMRDCIAKIHALAVETRAEAISTNCGSFLWPSLTGMRSGILSVPVRTGWEWRRSSEWRARVLQGRAVYPMLPMLYTGGFVTAAALQRARHGRPRFYHSCIPDVYSTMALSRVVPTYVYSWESVALSGLSSHSTGRAQFTVRRDDADQQAAVTFIQEGNIPFHRDIPLEEDGRYPNSMQAMVYESFLQVADIDPEPRPLPRERQLVVVLATAPRQHKDRIGAWARRFARQHDLDFDKAAAAARWYGLRLKARNLPAAVAMAYRVHTIGSESFPLKDINEACVAASIVLDVKPSRVRHALQKIRRRLDGTRARERRQLLL
jgi:hypothetical protein